MRLPVSLAVAGALLICGGVFLLSIPAALVVGGVEAVVAAYGVAYVRARA